MPVERGADGVRARSGVIKLTDFGLAAQLTATRDQVRAVRRVARRLTRRQRTTLVGTPDLLAPEVIAGQPYGTEVDVWALGMLVRQRSHRISSGPQSSVCCCWLLSAQVLKMCRASPLLHLSPADVLVKLQKIGPPRLTLPKCVALPSALVSIDPRCVADTRWR